MSKKFKIILVCIVIAFIVLVPISWYLGYKYGSIKEEEKVPVTENKDTNNNTDKENKEDNQEKDITPYEKFLQNAKNARKAEVIDKGADYEIRLTADGEIYVDVKGNNEDDKDIFNQIIDTKIVKYFKVNDPGIGDAGFGETMIFIREDGSISSIRYDNLLFGMETKVNRDFGDIKNIVEFYNKSKLYNEYEPYYYEVFAKDIDGKEINVSKYLDSSNWTEERLS